MAAAREVTPPIETYEFWNVVSANNLYEYLQEKVRRRDNRISETDLFFTVKHTGGGLYFNIGKLEYDSKSRGMKFKKISHISLHFDPRKRNAFHYIEDSKGFEIRFIPIIEYVEGESLVTFTYNKEEDKWFTGERDSIFRYFEKLLSFIVRRRLADSRDAGSRYRFRGSPPRSPYRLKYLKYKLKYLNLKKKLANMQK